MFHLLSLHTRALCLLAGICFVLTGCGTTRTSNTQRTATEQLLISDAIDRTVQSINFSTLAGESVFFDERHLYQAVDDAYLISSLRQHLLASGCVLKDNREEANYIVEPRAGAIGTDNDDLLFGIPATNLPQVTLLGGLPPAIPELPIIKRRHQRGVAKIAVFAYRRDTGAPIWQSGIATNESTANDVWFFGAGPFKKGTIHKGTTYGNHQQFLTDGLSPFHSEKEQTVSLGQEAVFTTNPPAPIQPATAIPYLASAPQRANTSPPPPQPTAASGPAIFPPPAN